MMELLILSLPLIELSSMFWIVCAVVFTIIQTVMEAYVVNKIFSLEEEINRLEGATNFAIDSIRDVLEKTGASDEITSEIINV